MCSETGEPEVTSVMSLTLPDVRTRQKPRKLTRLGTISTDIVETVVVVQELPVVDGAGKVEKLSHVVSIGDRIPVRDEGNDDAGKCERLETHFVQDERYRPEVDESRMVQESLVEDEAVQAGYLGRHGVDPTACQEQNHDDRGAKVAFEFDYKDEDSSAQYRKSRFAKEISAHDGRRSPGLDEMERRAYEGQRGSESKAWTGDISPAAQMLRRMEDYDRLYWSDSADELTPDVLTRAEEIAEEIYRDAIEMHMRLSYQSEMTEARAVSGKPGEGHGSDVETKETCGAITYTSTAPNSESGMLGEELRGRLLVLSEEQSLADPHNVPPDIPPASTEARSLSFSLPSQCSGDGSCTLENVEGQPRRIDNDGMDASSMTFKEERSDRLEENAVDGVQAGRKAGKAQSNEGIQEGRINNEVSHTKKTFDDYREPEKDAEFRNALEKEMDRLRESNVKKQAKIDSLQKWRTYYKEQIAKKDHKLEQLHKAYAAELKKQGKDLRKLKRTHSQDIALRDVRHNEAEGRLRAEIKELNLVIEELSKQLYEMEEHIAREGIPYVPCQDDDAGPSSKSLLSAVIGVKEAAHTFTRTFMSYLKQHPTESRELDELIRFESQVIVARPADYKFLVQSFICRRMFLDFESESFNIEECMTEIWDPEEHAKSCFQEFLAYKKVPDTVTVLTDNRPHNNFLREFCFKKFLSIVGEVTEKAFFGDFQHSDEIFGKRHPTSRFYESFCKLAVSVWLLHRLAFSFQPGPARMIPVPKGAQFNPRYMESAVPGLFCDDGADDDEGAAAIEALVGLMVHPGFRVGNSIIRAQVYLVTT